MAFQRLAELENKIRQACQEVYGFEVCLHCCQQILLDKRALQKPAVSVCAGVWSTCCPGSLVFAYGSQIEAYDPCKHKARSYKDSTEAAAYDLQKHHHVQVPSTQEAEFRVFIIG